MSRDAAAARVPEPIRRAIAVQLADGDPAGLPFDRLPPEQRRDELRMADWIVRTIHAAGYIICRPRTFGLAGAPSALAAAPAQGTPAPVVFERDLAGVPATVRNIMLLVEHTRSRTVLFTLADALDDAASNIAAGGGEVAVVQAMAQFARNQVNTLPKETT